MDIQQESVQEFVVGHGGVDAVSKPIVAAGYAPKAYKSVRVRAATANTIAIYVGPAGVTTDSGYPLPAGEELEVKIENPSRIHVVAEPSANCEQVVTISGEGAFTLTLNGETTDALASDATAPQVQTALQALSTVGADNCAVTGDAGGPFAVAFVGDLAKTDVTLMIGGGGGVNEQQTIAVTGGAAGDKLVLTYDGQSTAEVNYDATSAEIAAALKQLSNIADADVVVTDGDPDGWVVEFTGALAKTDVAAITGVCGKNEKQTISLDADVSGGTFTLTAAAETTGAIAYDASAADVQAALELLSTIGEGQVSVTGPASGPWVVEFTGTLGYTDVLALTGDGTNLVGDIKTVAVEETVKGNTATVTVEELVKGVGDCTATVTKNDITSGSQYSWIAV